MRSSAVGNPNTAETTSESLRDAPGVPHLPLRPLVCQLNTGKRKFVPRRIATIGFVLLILLAGLAITPTGQAQQRSVELQIYSDAKAPVGTQQRWMEMLQNVGADRVTVNTGSGTPGIEELQLSSGILITVNGVIESNQLKLPGGVFSIRDQLGIKDLVARLRDDGAQTALAEKKAFGLTSAQLVGLHQQLSAPVPFSTAGKPAAEIVAQISQLIQQPITLNQTAVTALNAPDSLVTDELQGLSAGTALATVVRPLGFVLEPQRPQGGDIQLKITNLEDSKENWPIGWPSERPPVQVEPKLFETLELEIRGFPLSDALNAIQKRTNIPFLYDHHAIAREGIELSQTRVTVVQKKISFMVAIGKLLRQSKPRLIEELRIDENGKPFLWISTP